jgi:hypothetical protein
MDRAETEVFSRAAGGTPEGRIDPYDVPPPDSSDAVRFIHRMTDDHLQIMVDIVCLEREKDGVSGSGRAGAVLSRVVADLCLVRDAAGAVVTDAGDPELSPLFHPDAPLAVYVTGLLWWTSGIVNAMRSFSTSIADGHPAWRDARRRVGRAGAMHLAGLADDSLSHVEALGGAPGSDRVIRFQRAFRNLTIAADRLGRSLRESFTLTPVE